MHSRARCDPRLHLERSPVVRRNARNRTRNAGEFPRQHSALGCRFVEACCWAATTLRARLCTLQRYSSNNENFRYIRSASKIPCPLPRMTRHSVSCHLTLNVSYDTTVVGTHDRTVPFICDSLPPNNEFSANERVRGGSVVEIQRGGSAARERP